MTFNRSWYATGTVSVNNAATAVTGVGTSWLSFGIREGDYFFAEGRMVPISAVGSNTGITLASGWPGTTLAGANYYIIPASDSVRTVVASRTVLDLLLNGIVASIAGLTGAADKMFYFTGANTFSTLDFKTWARNVVSAADVGAGQTALGLSTYFKTLLAAASSSALQPLLGVRELLTANRTYYVRADGSDTNTGLVDTAGGAFLTLQAAYNKIRSAIDFGGYTVTILCRTGTYAPLAINSDWVGGGNLVIEGDTTTPTNVHVSSTTVTSFRVTVPISAPISIRGFQLTFSGSSIAGVSVEAACRVNLQSIRFNGGSTGFNGCIRAMAPGAVITLQGSALSFNGGSASSLLQVGDGGQITNFGAVTFTITGTPAWSWVGVVAGTFGMISFASVTFSGSATGTRYAGSSMALLNTGGGGASYFPGNAAGSVSGGATYL